MVLFSDRALSPHTPILHQPVLTGIGRLDHESNWKAHLHRHPNKTELVYIDKGKGFVTVDGRRYDLHENQLAVYNCGQEHFEEFPYAGNPPVLLHCEFTSLQILGLPPMSIVPAGAPPRMDAGDLAEGIRDCLSVLYEECRRQELGYAQIIYARLESLILFTLRLYASYLPPLVYEAQGLNLALSTKIYIDNNYTKELHLETIGASLNVNSYHLLHAFTGYYGISPIQYLIGRRISEAKRLLLTSQSSIKEIALRIGYGSASNFIMQFRKHVGVSPLKFRVNGVFTEDNPNTWTEYIQ